MEDVQNNPVSDSNSRYTLLRLSLVEGQPPLSAPANSE